MLISCILANSSKGCIGYSRLVYMLYSVYQYEIEYSCCYKQADIQTIRLKQYHEATKDYKHYYYKSLYKYIDSYWYVNTLDTKSTIALIGIIRLCILVIQVLLAKYVPISIRIAYNKLNIWYY